MPRSSRFIAVVVFLAASLCAGPLFAVSVNSQEQAQAQRWAAAKFSGKLAAVSSGNYLSVEGRGSIQKNSHDGRPLRISSTQYERGLYADGAQTITVHLTAPARSLEAIVGLDGFSDGCAFTSGKYAFSVLAGGKTVLAEKVVEVVTPGVPVQANLNGAREFTLQSGKDIPEGWCGQAVWANARVTLENGQSLWLDELPIGPAESWTADLPFSFVYGGKPSRELLPHWTRKSSQRSLDAQRTEYTTSFTDPTTGLVVRWVGVEYNDYPVVEWTVYFENTGSKDTPILEDLRAIDTRFERAAGTEYTLHHFRGSPAGPVDYEPFETRLTPRTQKHIATSGGRPTDASLCYFNLDLDDQGVIVALGWPGQWAADFNRDEARGLQVRAGQELTHFKLLPGENVRTPLVALLFWDGDWLRGQNIWRKWMLAHNVPMQEGKPVTPKLAASSALWLGEMTRATEANQKLFLQRYHDEKIQLDYWWMDAGWYVSNGTWSNTGTWEVDPKRLPNGFRPIDDYAHSLGVQPIVWFEFERVTKDSWLWKQHPDWLLQAGVQERHGQRLLNLGNPEVVNWIVTYLDKFIREQDIDVYRIDFNIEPLPFWRETDAPDRQGITENKYVTGFLTYLDELKKRHPKIVIDTCASGGRRNDLETLRRALPMHRSDYSYEPVGQQNITYGMSFWIPYYGSPNNSREDYVFRSAWGPQVNLGWNVQRTDLDYEWMRRGIAQWRSVAANYLGDYYPLTAYDSSDSSWMAWQFDQPEAGEGMVQAFRRTNSPFDNAQLQLRGLDAGARYEVKNIDTGSTQLLSGKELMKPGLRISLPEKTSTAVLTYRRAGN
ncbi:MAG: alpha-galactosidase [Acidobacteria bacterium]|nr:alpha-galactosidase [Acidobacteriota bacterium]